MSGAQEAELLNGPEIPLSRKRDLMSTVTTMASGRVGTEQLRVELVESGSRPPHVRITMETARGRITYAEVEESEADLERFEKWLAAITARDYFHAPAGVSARAAVQQCRDALADFEAAALAAEFGEGETDTRRNSAVSLTVVEDAP